MARKITVKAFEEWARDPANVEDVLERIANGGTLHKVAREVNRPFTCLHALFQVEPWGPKYVAARKAWADARQDEAIELVDNVKPDRDHVAKVKLQAETYQNQAKAYNAERWADRKDGGAGGITVLVDRSCGGAVRVGVLDAGGNKAAIELSESEALPAPAGGE